MRSTHRILLALPFGALAVSSTALAQIPYGGQVFHQQLPFGQDAVGGSIRASLTGQSSPDVVTLIGTQPILSVAPGLHDTSVQIPVSANDVATLPGMGQNGRDALALVNTNGIQLWTWDVHTQTGLAAGVGSMEWADARLIRVADLNQDGAFDFCGVAASGTKVLVSLQIAGSWPLFDTLSIGSQIHDLTAADLDGDGLAEIAMATDDGLQISSIDGINRKSFPRAVLGSWLPFDSVAVLSDAVIGDRIAWLTVGGTPLEQRLLLMDLAGSTEPPLSLTPLLEGVSLVAGDLTGDGAEELVIASRSMEQHLVLLNVSLLGPVTFDLLNASVLLPFGGGIPDHNYRGRAALLDSDGDGDLDIAFGRSGESRESILVVNNVVDAFSIAPMPHFTEIVSTTAGQALRITMQDGPESASRATHLEIVVWHQPAYPGPIEPIALGRQRFALGASGDFAPLLNHPLDVAFRMQVPSSSVQIFEMRPVRMAAGAVVETFAGYLGAYSPQLSVLQQMQVDFYGVLFDGITNPTLQAIPFPDDGVLIGGSVPRPNLEPTSGGSSPGPGSGH
ncbi:MAG: VCBS repeat-containing protein [Planctomycetes bacterium]|nr:VCBS repeat-containing protein [Planctomycetota bacterium]